MRVEQCPVDIEHVDHIVDMRRYQVLIESDFPSELAGLFKNLENKGNPWGQSPSARTAWIDEMDIHIPVYGKDVDSFAGFEYLLVAAPVPARGPCEEDDEARSPSCPTSPRSTSWSSARRDVYRRLACRAGNEFLFQMLAQQNIEQVDELSRRRRTSARRSSSPVHYCFQRPGQRVPAGRR